MKLRSIYCVLLLVLVTGSLRAQTDAEIRAYINTYKELAITEQLRAGVPAAVTLAQGIHESTAGQSELAVIGNNHFGIKCKSTWMGETMLHDDDQKKECFRKYVNAEQSYIDHSDFLRGSNRYHFLFDLDRTDYAGWISGLKRAGYATNPAYVKKLTDLVEKYNLQQYTYEGISRANTTMPREVVPEADQARNLTQVDDPETYYKGLKGFWVQKGESLLPKAMEKNIRYARLLALNDLPDAPLEQTMFVFIEKKRRVGTEEFHVVKENENMLLIAQKEAMMLDNLFAFNNMLRGQEPEVGEKLALQYRSYETPRLKQQFLSELRAPADEQPIVVKVVEPKKTEPVKTETPRVENRTQPEPKAITLPVVEVQVAEEKRQDTRTEAVKPAEVKPVEVKPAEVKQETVKQEAVIPQEPKTTVQPVAQPATTTTPETEEQKRIAAKQREIEEEMLARQHAEEEQARQEALAELRRKEAEEQAQRAARTNDIPAKTQQQNRETGNEKGIRDPEKARRMEELLSTTPINAGSETANKPAGLPNTLKSEPSPVASPGSGDTKPTQAVAMPEPPELKRTYDEPGIDDSVKALKKKFDLAVYTPLPPRRIDTTSRVVNRPIIPDVFTNKPADAGNTRAQKPQPEKPARLNARQQAELKKKEAAERKKKNAKDKGKKDNAKAKTGAGAKKAADSKKNKPATKKSTKKK